MSIPLLQPVPAPNPQVPGAFSATPPSLATQEVRLATTMTGGVSLAIWMGGVTREINLLAQASTWRDHLTAADVLPDVDAADSPDTAVRELYLRLLDLMDVSISTDVLSGTSAGGINAALLALSRVRRVDLSTLRELWIEVGSMETLLRAPTDGAFPSLMYGDQVMLKALEDNLDHLIWPSAPGLRGFDWASWEAPPTSLFITTTLLDGETSRFSDSYGTLVQDTDHRGLFTFTEQDLDRRAGKNAIDVLALAARSSSSFPVAFEPSFLPFTEDIPASKNSLHHPAMASFANITRPHWVADGGLLANRPLRPLLEAIFNRPADRQTRRVLLYVVPSSGDVPAPLGSLPPDYFTAPPSLGAALFKDLTALLNQSISSDLRAIRDHNETLDVLSDARLRIAELGTHPQVELLTRHVLQDYRTRAGTALVRPVVSALSRLVSTLPTPDKPTATGQPAMPASWVQDLLTPADALARCEADALAAVTSGWAPAPVDYPSLSRFGRPAFDGAKAIVLAVLRHAFVLARSEHDRVALARTLDAVHKAFVAPARPDLTMLVQEVVKANPTLRVHEVAVAATAQYAHQLVVGPRDPPDLPEPSAVLETAWRALVTAVQTVRPLLDVLVRAPRAVPDSADAEAVTIYCDYLVRAEDPSPEEQGVLIARRLFGLHATDRALSPALGEVQQPVELIQVSADTRTLLDPARQTAGSKLTGMQLHHFGAFFKSSWRANDWMWGRIDGAGWLVHMLLDPKRIIDIVNTYGPTTGAADWFFAELRDRVAGNPPTPTELPTPRVNQPNVINEELVRAELSFLDDRTRRLPKSLPLTALWVAATFQRWIAANELPELAHQIDQNGRENTSPWSRSVGVELSTRPADRLGAMAQLLASNPVSGHTLDSQVGSPLMARTATKVLATATAAVATEARVPKAARPVTTALRTTTLAAYRITTATNGTPRSLLLTGLVALVLGIAVALQQDTVLGLAGSTLALAGALVLVLGVWGLGRRAIRALLAVVVLAAALLPTLPWSRHWLFASDTQPGLVGRHVQAWVRWLGDAWWHPLLVLGLIVATLGVTSVLGSRSKPATRQHRSDKASAAPPSPVVEDTSQAVASGSAVPAAGARVS